MNLSEYARYWKTAGDNLYCIGDELLRSIHLLGETKEFLGFAGLPDSVAPFLSFSEIKEQSLRSPNLVFGIDYPELARYIMIGSNGSGDPVCIDSLIADQIVYLNHDNYFERVFVSSSISQLGFALIQYRDFLKSITPTGSSNLKKRKFSDAEFEVLRQIFIDNDPICLNKNTFWQMELDDLVWWRENE